MISSFILLVFFISLVAGIAAVVICVRTREDAFRAAEKLTKPAWTAIVSIASAVLFLTMYGAGFFSMFAIFALVAIVVFWVDVYPQLKEVQTPKNW